MPLWVESHAILLRHRKTRDLARELGTKRVIVLGMIHAFWHNVIEQREDGDLTSWTDAAIADCCELYAVRDFMFFKGDDTDFVELLRKTGWMDGPLLHDWLDFAGRFLRTKYASRNRELLISIWKKHGRAYGADGIVNQVQTECKPDANQMHSNGDSIPGPIPLPKPKPKTKRHTSSGDDADPLFDAFWGEYPRKKGKKAAKKVWKKMTMEQKTTALAAIKKQKAWGQFSGKEAEFIPHPTTWLNQGRWDDEPDEQVTKHRATRSNSPPECVSCSKPPVPFSVTCDSPDCAYCVDCDSQNEPSKKSPIDLVRNPTGPGAICKSCAQKRIKNGNKPPMPKNLVGQEKKR